MPYLIDGHNLIGQLPDLALTDPNDEAQLVQKLISFVARTRTHCVVIFDHGLPGGRSRMSTGKIEVVFASRPGEADDLMLRRIRELKDAKGWIVVSSDARVINAARRKRLGVLLAAEFVQRLQDASRRSPSPADKPSHVSPDEVTAWLKEFGQDDEEASSDVDKLR